MAMIAMLVLAASILLFAGASSVIPFAAEGYWNPPGVAAANTDNPGAHGLSEILYTIPAAREIAAHSPASTRTPLVQPDHRLRDADRTIHDVALAAARDRGSLAEKKQVPVSAGTFPTRGPLFVGLLVGVVIIVGALTYFPALSLGPIVEHLML